MDTDLLLYPPLVLPAAAALVYAVFGWRTWTAWSGVGTAAGQLAAAIALGPQIVHGTARTAAGGLLRADALTGFMLIVISAVALIATWASVHHIATEQDIGRMSSGDARRYGTLIHAFLAAVGAAVLADNLGLMWVALEATTVITAFLVGHRRDRASLEAAWKYVVLCSVGIAMAFLGTVCVYATALHAGGHGADALDWTFLLGHANRLDPQVIRLAAGLAVLGFGTKAGLAPMHAWLPDAHSQAPAPVSALMSGVLLSVAFTAILRYKVLTDAVLGPGYMRALLVAAALASLAVAALLLISQRDYKRMLAYSSIEHMGLAALGAAAGTRLAAAAVLLHVLGHGLAKAVAFTSAGQILQRTRTSRIAGVRGLATSKPALAGVFGLAVAALAGLPPFPLFASELGIARSTAAAGLGWVLAAALVLLLVIFAALARHTTAMLLGPAPGTDPATPVLTRGAVTPLALALIAAAILGTALGPLQPLLRAAATIVGAP
ncbi:proton-conducting transporter membrane subunit [Actinoallomurus sp. NBC_01490]|uniref:proton-conducting transporter transmembrane domain-containing protein n=1 Tax=Actinoallomurus sp. NBC_01490 TaxID=2903557 RepID=UPI002E31580E|nr:proton-conducting transporter membrane subunit [Actinoallomurus sp. NBC_01490]